MRTINVARDFSRFPAGRYRRNGRTSGEAFREDLLSAPLSAGETIVVELDGTIGYGSSFLEEAFGGLVRQLGIQPDTLLKRITLTSSDPTLIEEIKGYIRSTEKKNK